MCQLQNQPGDRSVYLFILSYFTFSAITNKLILLSIYLNPVNLSSGGIKINSLKDKHVKTILIMNKFNTNIKFYNFVSVIYIYIYI